MKAKKKTLLVLIALLAAVGIVYALLTHANEQAAASESESGKIVLSSFSADTLRSLSYRYKDEDIVLDNADGTWTLAGDPAYHVNQTTVDSMAAALCQLTASQIIENVTDYSQYGVDTPDLTVTAQVADETMTFYFGGQNTISDIGYLQMAGDDNVYAVSSGLESTFQFDKAGLYDTSWLPVTLRRSELARIDYQCVSGEKTYTASLQAENEPASGSTSDSGEGTAYTQVWYAAGTGDTVIPLMASNMLDAVFSAPSEQNTQPGELSQYGLDFPSLTVKLTDTSGNEQTVYVGIGVDHYYLMRDGDTSVYTVTGDAIKAFAHSAEDLKQAAADDPISAESALNPALESAGGTE